MTTPSGDATPGQLDAVYRAEYPRVLAAVAASTGDLDLAEECVQEAFGAAMTTWPERGVPDRPGAWLTTTARRRAIDVMRREGRRAPLERMATDAPPGTLGDTTADATVDERLGMVFLTCHPSFTPATRVAMTLRFVIGLRAHEIARLLGLSEGAVHKQVQRARAKVSDARIPLRLPSPARLHERLPSVLDCLHLVFTEGYAATAGDDLIRSELCAEAIALTRELVALAPDDIRARALLSLELFQDARRDARLVDGRIVLLEDQDRSTWHRPSIGEAVASLRRAESLAIAAPTGPDSLALRYLLEARIASVHATAPRWDDTDWKALASHYDDLWQLTGSHVVALNRVVVRARFVDPADALAELDRVDPDRVGRRHLWHAVRADLLGRAGDPLGASTELRAALDAGPTAPERALLEERLRALGDVSG